MISRAVEEVGIAAGEEALDAADARQLAELGDLGYGEFFEAGGAGASGNCAWGLKLVHDFRSCAAALQHALRRASFNSGIVYQDIDSWAAFRCSMSA